MHKSREFNNEENSSEIGNLFIFYLKFLSCFCIKNVAKNLFIYPLKKFFFRFINPFISFFYFILSQNKKKVKDKFIYTIDLVFKIKFNLLPNNYH